MLLCLPRLRRFLLLPWRLASGFRSSLPRGQITVGPEKIWAFLRGLRGLQTRPGVRGRSGGVQRPRAPFNPSKPFCFKCGDSDHLSISRRNAIVCFRCKGMGHRSFSCSLARRAPKGPFGLSPPPMEGGDSVSSRQIAEAPRELIHIPFDDEVVNQIRQLKRFTIVNVTRGRLLVREVPLVLQGWLNR